MNTRTVLLKTLLGGVALAVPPACAQDATTPTPPIPIPIPAPAPSPVPAQPEFTTAGQVLDALEDVHIGRLSASIRYTKIREFLGEREMQLGTMQFVSIAREGKQDQKKFAVCFESLYIGNTRDDEPRIIIYDGRWFVEKFPNEKLIIKREVARPGDEADPLRIGEGPFPIPIGQKKADILSRYDAELLDASDGLTLDPEDPDVADDPDAAKNAAALVNFVKDAYQIRLTPRKEFGDTLDLAEIRLWYKRDKPERGGTLLPTMARTVDIDGNISIIQLLNVRVGEAARIDEAMFDVAVPEGWNAQIRQFGG